MADEVLRISDGESHLRIVDPVQGAVLAPLIEIGSGGAFSSVARAFETNAYLDVTVALKGQAPRQFFANVVSSGPAGLRLAWMHIDPGEQTRLRALIESYRSQSADGGSRTRRILKPSALPAAPVSAPAEFTPFSDAEPVAPAQPTRVGTRRVLKPSTFGTLGAPKPDLVPEDAEIQEESQAQQVVLAPTDRFVQMRDLHEPKTPASPPADEAASGSAQAPAVIHPVVTAPEEPADRPRGTVMGQDGRMDIGATIRNKAKTVRASELAARHDKVRVLNMATIKALIQEAVEEAAGHLTRALNEADRKRLLEEAEESFQERLKAFQLEKADADERANKLHEQLSQAQRLLEEERKRTISADQFTVSAAGMDEMEAKFQRMVERSAAEGKVNPSLLEELRKATSHVLDEERQRIREKEMQAQNDKIALLEKKIGRLAGNLEAAERQRDEARHLAQALEANAGSGPLDVERIKNKFKTGLDQADPLKAAKLAAMRELMESNRELRRQLGIALNPVVAPAATAPVAAPAEPEPVPVPVPPEEPIAQASSSINEEEAIPEEDPDDLPWTPDAPTEPAAEGDGLVGGIKRIRSFAAKPPPLLEITIEEDPAEPEDGTAEVAEVNPDDEIWEPPAVTTPDESEAEVGGIKRIRSFKAMAPPPLDPR